MDSYGYDAYGVMLGGNPTASSPAGTNLLYAGEQFDTDVQQYYLRARYYNPLNGRFNRLDPYSGNTSDPQSLHKYLYCHANPINGIDPSGLSLSTNFVVTMAIGAGIGTITGFIAGKVLGIGGARGAILGFVGGGALGFAFGIGRFLDVFTAGLINGCLKISVEFLLLGFGFLANNQTYHSLELNRLADAFLSGFAFGAASAAFSFKYPNLGALGGATVAAVTSIITDLVDLITKGKQGPSVGEILANAIVTFLLALATNPQYLFDWGEGKYSAEALKKAADELTRIPNTHDRLAKIVSGGLGVMVDLFKNTIQKYIQGYKE